MILTKFVDVYKSKYGIFYSKYTKYFIRMLFSCFLIVLLISISTAYAVNVTVSPDGIESNNSTINDAIDYVNSINDLDNIITLQKAVYNTDKDRNNNITINGNLKIIGNGSPSNIIVDGNNLGYLFKISPNSNVIFENITFINGNNDYGGAINNVGRLLVNNSIFENNSAISGGAIYSIANTYISLSNFTNNSEAIWISGIGNTIISSTISNNQKGIFIDGSTISAVINYNRIFNNTSFGFDLENFGINTNADLNWWGTNYPIQEQINNNGTDFNMNYWYVLQITLDDDIYLKSTELNFTKNLDNIYLAYNLSTNKPVNHNPLLLPMFNVIVICPFNNTWNRNIQTFSIGWGNDTRWGLPINEYNTYYSVQAYVDNEYVLVEIIYDYPNIIVSDTKSTTNLATKLSASLLTISGKPIYNKTIEFFINGIIIGSNKTDVNGLAIYHYTFNEEGTFDIQSIFNGDEDYSSSKAESQTFISILPSYNNNNNNNSNYKINEINGNDFDKKSETNSSNHRKKLNKIIPTSPISNRNKNINEINGINLDNESESNDFNNSNESNKKLDNNTDNNSPNGAGVKVILIIIIISIIIFFVGLFLKFKKK